MESLKEATFTLLVIPGAAKVFPIDPKGTITITFGTNTYKCKPHVLEFSSVLRECVDSGLQLDISQTLIYGRSEEAFDLLMRSLVGITETVIPRRLFVQFYYLLEELKISTEEDDDFKENFLKKYLSEPTENNVF